MSDVIRLTATIDPAINYAFQQNAIPFLQDVRVENDQTQRRQLVVRIRTEPAFALPMDLHVEEIQPGGIFSQSPVALKLSHDFLAGLNEKVTALVRVELCAGEAVLATVTEEVSLLARNEWCGLVALPELLAAFVQPNDPAVMTVLDKSAELLRLHTAGGILNGYQDRNRGSAWNQVAAIYRAIGELGIRYISPSASFQETGQKVRTPSEILAVRFGTCLDLALLFASCCEQAGLHPLVLIHDGHAYPGCWLEERTLPNPADDDLQQIRKLATDELLTVFESTLITNGDFGTLKDAERKGHEHLSTDKPFRLALDVKRARMARILPLPVPGQEAAPAATPAPAAATPSSLGERSFSAPVILEASPETPQSRVDRWKSRLLDLSLRNRLLNFKETKSVVRILTPDPTHLEDELASDRELSLLARPKIMGEDDPRNAALYTAAQREDALVEQLRSQFRHKRLHTSLPDSDHSKRLTQLFRDARTSLEENGTNSLYVAVGFLEWRETERADRVLRAPLLLVPVELRRASVAEGFSLRRIDEETRLNVTLMEMLRQNFQKQIPGLDPLPEDESGVDVRRVLAIFREAVRPMIGWEVKEEVWLAEFSFTKFLLWKDLSDRLEVLLRNPIVHHLVNEAGKVYTNTRPDIDPRELDTRYHPREVFCPRSADSSQMAAVMAAAEGHDFIIEGPPGTGKSQTITNIIAQCLARGKRVLFVAEKRAALEVVFRRLREDGLEPFCLELHSNKVGKTQVLAQFDQALKFAESASAEDWEQEAAELERLRSSLNNYEKSLHRRHPCGLSAYQCFSHLMGRRHQSLPKLEQIAQPLAVTAEQLSRLRGLSNLLQERLQGVARPLAGHPLTAVSHANWTPQWAEEAQSRLELLSLASHAALGASRAVAQWLELPHADINEARLTALAEFCRVVRRAEPAGPGLIRERWTRTKPQLADWKTLITERRQLRRSLSGIHEGSTRPPKLRCELWNDETCTGLLADARSVGAHAEALGAVLAPLVKWLRIPRWASTREALQRLIPLTALLPTAPQAGEGAARVAWGDWREDLEQWIALAKERAELRRQLLGYTESSLMALDPEGLSAKWEKAQRSWFLPRWIHTGAVIKALSAARPDRIKPSPTTVTETLTKAKRLSAVNHEFARVAERAPLYLGPLWNGGEPSAEHLSALWQWCDELERQLTHCAQHDEQWKQEMRSAISFLFKPRVGTASPAAALTGPLVQLPETLDRLTTEFDSLTRRADLIAGRINTGEDFPSLVRAATEAIAKTIPALRAINGKLAEASSAGQQILAALWRDGEVEPEELDRVAAWAEDFHRAHGAVGIDLEGWRFNSLELLAGFFPDRVAELTGSSPLADKIDGFLASMDTLRPIQATVANLLALDLRPLSQAKEFLASLVGMTMGVSGAWGAIREWCAWREARNAAIAADLEPLVTLAESSPELVEDLPGTFESSFRKRLVHAIIAGDKLLLGFFGHEHEKQIERFRAMDEKLQRLASAVIRTRLVGRIPTDQRGGEVPKAEMGLLRREIGKKMRHIPVRKLLSQIPALLPRLKPCLLMSPLSVAQYLDATHESFDVVIFDEASQIPVWDAVGAIARGSQLIVVGDPKQLPPTNFFSRTADDEIEETPEEQKDLESILDELLTVGLRLKRLAWHYRSRHEGLITFSNRQYYEGSLLTFPSPNSGLGGVQLRHVPGARYEKGKSRTNRAEAEALVSELVKRLRDPQSPLRSYGVVTFSQAQQALVENLLDEERRKHPEIEIHFGEDSPVASEPVFVKNLENVQGDERDVIFFSICYGPDETGRVGMNFGPLNREGGERRLNVAVTRAKHEILVFSGLRPEQIDLTRTRARGVRDLKMFLEYAERGAIALSAATTTNANADWDSEFERLVEQRLRAAGYEVHRQVGCSSYRIDLAVVHPEFPGSYLLGIECDGASYHSAATARDRDKLRQAILEGLGWKIHRIWSTDWWHKPEEEFEKLHAKLKTLLALSAAGRPSPVGD